MSKKLNVRISGVWYSDGYITYNFDQKTFVVMVKNVCFLWLAKSRNLTIGEPDKKSQILINLVSSIQLLSDSVGIRNLDISGYECSKKGAFVNDPILNDIQKPDKIVFKWFQLIFQMSGFRIPT